MHEDDIDLNELHNQPYGGPDPAYTKDSSEPLALDDEQQEKLKELMATCTIDQLQCLCRCCEGLAHKMREELSEQVKVEDFESAKKEKEESYDEE